MLLDLYLNLYDTEEITTTNARDLTPRLNAVAPPGWTWRLIYSVLKGYPGFTETGELQDAAQKVAIGLDGSHPWQAAREITVLSPNGVEPGSVITGHTIYCPSCGVKFVPDYGHRKYCHVCRPPRRK